MDLVSFMQSLEFLEEQGVMLVDKKVPFNVANNGEVVLINKIDKSFVVSRLQDKL